MYAVKAAKLNPPDSIMLVHQADVFRSATHCLHIS